MSVYEESITHYCYCLKVDLSYDPEMVWELVQTYDGYLSIGVGGEVYYWIPRDYQVLLLLKFPLLVRCPPRDYV